jgi:hypothetical protein
MYRIKIDTYNYARFMPFAFHFKASILPWFFERVKAGLNRQSDVFQEV